MYWHRRSSIFGRPDDCPAFSSLHKSTEGLMSQSKAREDAELAFSDVQSQFFGRGNAVEEIDHVTRSREEKNVPPA